MSLMFPQLLQDYISEFLLSSLGSEGYYSFLLLPLQIIALITWLVL